ncbi:MAG: diacylglycerol kinase family protein [Terriglobales bacterium]
MLSVIKSLGVRAVAILGPDVPPQYLALFSGTGCEIIGHKRGEPVPSADAAIVLGGDGTIHHYLRDLSQLKIPVLVVPRGSGNDFAHALGLRTEGDAVAAWNRFLGFPPAPCNRRSSGCICGWRVRLPHAGRSERGSEGPAGNCAVALSLV